MTTSRHGPRAAVMPPVGQNRSCGNGPATLTLAGVKLLDPPVFFPSTPEERESAIALHHMARTWHNTTTLRAAMLRAERRLEQTIDLGEQGLVPLEIRWLHEAFGITTLYVTHDQAEAMVISDRIAVLNNGISSRVACDGTT